MNEEVAFWTFVLVALLAIQWMVKDIQRMERELSAKRMEVIELACRVIEKIARPPR